MPGARSRFKQLQMVNRQRLRDLVVLGYFTSEQGATKALRYLPVPGKFESDLPVKTWPYQTTI